jgi:hypothetical protein
MNNMKKFKVTYMEVVKYEFELEGESKEDIQENIYEKMNNVFDPQDELLIDSYVENIEEV